MIVARICDSSGKALVNVGTIRLAPYDGAADGWFPVDGFNFGFQDRGKDGGGGGGGAGGGAGAHAAPAKGGAPSHGAGPAGGHGKGGSEDFAELSIEKQVDTVSASLMLLAMKERKSKKGTSRDSETKLEADIHVVSSISLEKQQEGRFTYTSLMIHLEAVNIMSWDIRGSGDSRPTENVKLRYDRAAMIYFATAQGQTFLPVGPYGWDQTANSEFNWNTAKFKRYFPPM